MANSDRFYFPLQQAFSNAGAIGVGYKLKFWVASGAYSVLKDSYSESTLTTANANPVVADASGRFGPIFLSGSYGVQLFDSNDVLLWAQDPVATAGTTAATTTTAGVVELSTLAESLLGSSSTLVPPVANVTEMIQSGFFQYGGTAGGTANALTGTPAPLPTALAAGMKAILRASATNGAVTTLNWATLGAIAVKIIGSSGPQACVGGEIINTNFYEFDYSTSDSAWILLNPSPTSAWPKGALSGLEISRASATTFGIAVGVCRNEDSGSARDMTLAAAITKSLSAFAAGTGNGGLDTGAVANTTWYHVHLIRKDSDGTIDVLCSTSVAAPTMPTGYTARRRIGSFLTNGSAQIVAFSQNGDEFLWDVALVDVDATNPGTAAVSRTLTTPLGVKVRALLHVGVYGGTNANTTANISSLDVSDQGAQAAGTAALTLMASTGNGAGSGGADAGIAWDICEAIVRTNTSSAVRSRLQTSGAADHLGIITRGWLDSRGK